MTPGETNTRIGSVGVIVASVVRQMGHIGRKRRWRKHPILRTDSCIIC